MARRKSGGTFPQVALRVHSRCDVLFSIFALLGSTKDELRGTLVNLVFLTLFLVWSVSVYQPLRRMGKKSPIRSQPLMYHFLPAGSRRESSRCD